MSRPTPWPADQPCKLNQYNFYKYVFTKGRNYSDYWDLPTYAQKPNTLPMSLCVLIIDHWVNYWFCPRFN